MGKIDAAVTELSALLDTFYTEVDGWLELADLYNSCQQYDFPLRSLQFAFMIFVTQIHICLAIVVACASTSSAKPFPLPVIRRNRLSRL